MGCVLWPRRARPMAALDVHCCRRAGRLLHAPSHNHHDLFSIGVSTPGLLKAPLLEQSGRVQRCGCKQHAR